MRIKRSIRDLVFQASSFYFKQLYWTPLGNLLLHMDDGTTTGVSVLPKDTQHVPTIQLVDDCSYRKEDKTRDLWVFIKLVKCTQVKLLCTLIHLL